MEPCSLTISAEPLVTPSPGFPFIHIIEFFNIELARDKITVHVGGQSLSSFLDPRPTQQVWKFCDKFSG